MHEMKVHYFDCAGKVAAGHYAAYTCEECGRSGFKSVFEVGEHSLGHMGIASPTPPTEQPESMQPLDKPMQKSDESMQVPPPTQARELELREQILTLAGLFTDELSALVLADEIQALITSEANRLAGERVKPELEHHIANLQWADAYIGRESYIRNELRLVVERLSVYTKGDKP